MLLALGALIDLDGALTLYFFTLGALVAFNGYLAHLAWPTIALGWTWSMARRGLTSMERIQEILALVPAGEPAAARAVAESAPTAFDVRESPASAAVPIEFRRLTFGYDHRPPVLRDVTFTVGAGEHAAFSKEAADLLLEAGIIKQVPDLSKLADTRFIK